jgi:hypothetical protein
MGQMGTHAGSVGLYPNLAYKPDVDFAPIGLVVDQAVVIFARKDFPPTNLKEFLGQASLYPKQPFATATPLMRMRLSMLSSCRTSCCRRTLPPA